MSILKAKMEIHFTVDLDTYPIPADGRITMQLKEDIQEALEAHTQIEINAIKVTKLGGNNEQVRSED